MREGGRVGEREGGRGKRSGNMRSRGDKKVACDTAGL